MNLEDVLDYGTTLQRGHYIDFRDGRTLRMAEGRDGSSDFRGVELFSGEQVIASYIRYVGEGPYWGTIPQSEFAEYIVLARTLGDRVITQMESGEISQDTITEKGLKRFVLMTSNLPDWLSNGLDTETIDTRQEY